MIADLELLKEQAQQAELLLSAKSKYEQALAEQQKQDALAQAEQEIAQLQDNLDSKIDDFKTELAETATELTYVLTRLHELESKFDSLAKQADNITLIMQAQAGAEIRAGWHNQIAKEQGLTRADNLFLSGLVTSKLKNRFGFPNPLTYNFGSLVLSDLGKWLLSSPYFEQIKLQLIGPSLGYQIEPKADEITKEIKVNSTPSPIVSSPENGQGKMLSFEEVEKLFPSLAAK